MCAKDEESVNHVFSERSKLAQKDYKKRHHWFRKRSIRKYVKIRDRSERKVEREQAGGT